MLCLLNLVESELKIAVNHIRSELLRTSDVREPSWE